MVNTRTGQKIAAGKKKANKKKQKRNNNMESDSEDENDLLQKTQAMLKEAKDREKELKLRLQREVARVQEKGGRGSGGRKSESKTPMEISIDKAVKRVFRTIKFFSSDKQLVKGTYAVLDILNLPQYRLTGDETEDACTFLCVLVHHLCVLVHNCCALLHVNL